ncbi:MAG TPA: PilC/PilY family type IV pilus protein, partial [Pseudoxanthomonas sp.]|nr:PilC/PilY family type IV pilus protein [Pseudoxanthomonas sp.]
DPLWYAAKYGGFIDGNENDLPDGGEWDSNGNGIPDNYFLVTNPLNLRTQLTAAFDLIQQQDGNSGTLSVSGARVGADSFVVLPSYNSLAGGRDWVGDLKAYSLTSDGQLGAQRWSAASRLATAAVADRKIYTATSNVTAANRTTVVTPFVASNLGASPSEIFGRLGYTLAQVINVFGGSTTPQQMVDYLRGARGREGTTKDVAPFRKRTSILGDIINSPPVIATRRANYGWASATGLTAAQRESYTAYVTAKADKAEFTFVGANDGMLHAFGQNGDESFAYIPNGVLGNLGLLADPNYEHRYYVDGGLTLSDALIQGSWKTVMVGAAGAGGRTVFALDVTAPESFGTSNVLWEVNSITDPDMGYVMGKPLIVPTDSGRWVAVFGNGYNSVNFNPVLFVVDIATGEVLRKITPDDGTNESNGLGNLSVVDTNNNGLVDTVYGGDLQGNVWKFDIGGATPASWTVALSGKPLFVAMDSNGARQPITGSFEVAVGPGAGYMIYFGTGRYFVSGDNSASLGQQVQTLYGIWDNGTALSNGRTTLVQQRITGNSGTSPQLRSVTRNPVSYLANRGWYLDLVVGASNTGERFIAAPRIQSGKVYFPTYQPGFASDCAPGGTNWLYALNPLSGGAAFGKITQPNNVGDGDTGAVATGNGAPNRSIGITEPLPSSQLFCDPTKPDCADYCDPASPTCGGREAPPNRGCSQVFIDSTNPTVPIVVQRACGRQSWRQLL